MNNVLAELFAVQNRIAKSIPTEFKRYLKIDWDKKLIILTGARGTEKTTLVLQYYLESFSSTSECLYFSVDNPLVAKQGIYEIDKEYFSLYGKTIIIDEVHKQADWATAVKALYDSYPANNIVVLGSSKLNITNQKGDLSHRALLYKLKGLSFREFVELKYMIKLPVFSFQEILADHVRISSEINRQIPELKKYFFEYKQYGFYLFFQQYSETEYHRVLHNVVDKIIYEDVPSLKNIKSSSSLVFKKLIAYLAMSKIPNVQVSSMCNELDIPKETLYEYLDLLNRTDMINIVRRRNASVRSLQQAKILLLNPNLYYVISNELWKHEADLGNIREAFFVSQIESAIFASEKVDYTVQLPGKEIEIEIGGRSKSQKQVKELENSYIFKDDIEVGYKNVINS